MELPPFDLFPCDFQSLWTLSVLDDIAMHALRLKFIAILPRITKPVARTQLMELIFAEGRFSLSAASALVKVRRESIVLNMHRHKFRVGVSKLGYI